MKAEAGEGGGRGRGHMFSFKYVQQKLQDLYKVSGLAAVGDTFS